MNTVLLGARPCYKCFMRNDSLQSQNLPIRKFYYYLHLVGSLTADRVSQLQVVVLKFKPRHRGPRFCEASHLRGICHGLYLGSSQSKRVVSFSWWGTKSSLLFSFQVTYILMGRVSSLLLKAASSAKAFHSAEYVQLGLCSGWIVPPPKDMLKL